MRSQTYGDKQRDAQRRKKEELRKKSNPEGEVTSNTPANADNANEAPDKTEKKDTPERRSA